MKLRKRLRELPHSVDRGELRLGLREVPQNRIHDITLVDALDDPHAVVHRKPGEKCELGTHVADRTTLNSFRSVEGPQSLP